MLIKLMVQVGVIANRIYEEMLTVWLWLSKCPHLELWNLMIPPCINFNTSLNKPRLSLGNDGLITLHRTWFWVCICATISVYGGYSMETIGLLFNFYQIVQLSHMFLCVFCFATMTLPANMSFYGTVRKCLVQTDSPEWQQRLYIFLNQMCYELEAVLRQIYVIKVRGNQCNGIAVAQCFQIAQSKIFSPIRIYNVFSKQHFSKIVREPYN